MRWVVAALVLGVLSCGGHALRSIPAGGTDANDIADASGPADANSGADSSVDLADGLNKVSNVDAANEAASPFSLCASPGDDGGLGQAQADGGVVVASIVYSQSTNTDGWEWDLYCDGSAVEYTLPRRYGPDPVPVSTYYDPPGTSWAVQCLAALQALGDVSTIAVDWCSKSVSFGTTTTISYNGKSTPDLQCPHKSDTPAQSAMLAACL
jgi:hypothetical protein